jgi:tetratricopeptide (TPR) repeat protein
LWLFAATIAWTQESPSAKQENQSVNQESSSVKKPTSTAEKIEYYQKQVEKHPKHYPAYARLGRAWLEKARKTYDPAALADARKALQRSLEIQPSYEAFYYSAEVASYSHRFEEALEWCRKAAEAYPEDKSVLAIRVDALMALGRRDEARAAIGGNQVVATDFYTAAALGHWLVAGDQREEAVAQFLAAARYAKNQEATSFAVWATVMAAGVWLDAGDLAKAKPLLDEAAGLDSSDRILKIHQAELAAAEDRPADSLRIYEELLPGQPDPELHRRAIVLARKLGLTTAADEHFTTAERLCLRAVDAGEIFSLEVLAKLYCDAGRENEAVRFAERNFEVKRDAAAKETLERARQASGAKQN